MPVSLTNINIGSAPGDDTGDPARTAFGTINDNNDALEAAVLTQAEVDARVEVVAPTASASANGPASVFVVSATVNDDEAFEFDFGTDIAAGILVIAATGATTNRGIFAFRAHSSSPHMTSIASSSITATTGALTGTTGADGAVTLSAHTDNKIYLENRSGGAKFFQIQITASQYNSSG